MKNRPSKRINHKQARDLEPSAREPHTTNGDGQEEGEFFLLQKPATHRVEQEAASEEALLLLSPAQRVSPPSKEYMEGYSTEQEGIGHDLSLEQDEMEWDFYPTEGEPDSNAASVTDPAVSVPSKGEETPLRSTLSAPTPPISGTHLRSSSSETDSNAAVGSFFPAENEEKTRFEEAAVPNHALLVSSDFEEVELTAEDVVDMTNSDLPARESETSLEKTLRAMFGESRMSVLQADETLTRETDALRDASETPLHLDAVQQSLQPTREQPSYRDEDGTHSPVVVQQSRRKEEEYTSPSIRAAEEPLLRSAPMMRYQGALSSYVLTEVLKREADRVQWQAMDATMEARNLIVEEMTPLRYARGFKNLIDLQETVIQTPVETLELEDRVLVVFEQPSGERLSDIIDDLQFEWDLPQVLQFCKPIARTLQTLHEQRYLFLQLSLDQLWIEEGGTPLITGVEQLYTGKTPFHMRPFHQGFAAPEMFERDTQLDRRTDVFALALLYHYMFSRCQPFNHLHLPELEIPSPRVFNLSFPVTLEPVFARAYHPVQDTRTASVAAFLEQLESTWQSLERRSETERFAYDLQIGHDIHIGIRKGKRNPVNQDALFWRYDRERGKGLFVVADGVSVCQYGSGDKASSIVIQIARKRWETLLEKPIFDQPFSQSQRHQVLRSIVESANKGIAQEINRSYPAVHGFVEDVMGSTCVAAFVDGANITIANLGDSRALLKSGDSIEQLTVDHNFKTFQMQSLEDMETVMSLTNGSLLTRCVGSYRKDEAERLVTDELHPDFFDFQLLPGDTVLLCSDGLTDYAGTNEEEKAKTIESVLTTYPDPVEACFWLIALANQNGGGDNISCIALKVPE